MPNPSAWFCPACQRHHAPHVDTCPGGIGAFKIPNGLPNSIPTFVPTVWPTATGMPPNYPGTLVGTVTRYDPSIPVTLTNGAAGNA